MFSISETPKSTLGEGRSPICSSTKAEGKRLSVTFSDIDVQVNGLGEDYIPTCWSCLGSLLPHRQQHIQRHILRGVSGQVQPGEMMLVIGRPGSGCTTLLKILSNQREGYLSIDGDVHFGNAGPAEANSIQSQIVMSPESDSHFPTLSVSQTIKFAATTKSPRSEPQEETTRQVDAILGALSMSHTRDTIVGNDFIRGVSGGERKRVSIAEVMATKAPFQVWDNSTRGLDATNAYALARVWRKAADDEQKTIIATLYQTSNLVYSQFDKVLVLAEGRQIYYGPATMAKQYFENMGFRCRTGSNLSDFLTSVTVLTEREIRPGYRGSVPSTAKEFEERFKSSDLYESMMKNQVSITADSISSQVADLRAIQRQERGPTIQVFRGPPPFTTSYLNQVWTCSIRQFQILLGDWKSILLQVASSLVIALVTGSLYFNLPLNSSALFAKTGALCYPILYFAMTRMAETTASFAGRPIISRQKSLGFVRPSSYALALAVVDVPVIIAVFTLFQIIYYFMVGFQQEVGKFFICYLVLLVFTLSFASMFRMVGAWCRHPGVAFQINGAISTMFLVYIGYMIPLKHIPVWFRWIAWMNPAVYAYNAIMANEMADLTIECIEPQHVPFGPTYNNSLYRQCSVIGSFNTHQIDGETFIDTTYWASKHWMWVNLLILVGFWVFFAAMAALGFEARLHRDAGAKLLFAHKSHVKLCNSRDDIERAVATQSSITSTAKVVKSVTFTFKDICYFFQDGEQERQLLCDVSGFAKQGQLVALMGSSGAGKTTLMDVLAQRKDAGRVEGSILVNGRPQGITFQRRTGYCEQNDVHEPTATILENLMFSARLRQSYDIPDKDKEEYVYLIMDLLELTHLQHAIVGTIESGLSIEQRKRLTLATELVAKPSLLFLDEPTSGLDGQSAYEVCRFLRKLASAGLTIICTIHQPSALLFDSFDSLLLLAKGGKTAYFGPIGNESTEVLEYFARRGASCPPGANPAEHIIDVVQGQYGPSSDWPQQWLQSDERKQIMLTLDLLSNDKEGYEATVSTDQWPRENDDSGFATPLLYQVLLVARRQSLSLWRNPDYVWNKLVLHMINGLFGGFTFWKLGNGVFDMQLHMMAIFNFITVAPGCINQLQPLFIQNRDIFEAREKKSKTYHWSAFVAAQILAEVPLLIVCGTLVFVCWYFAVGFPNDAKVSGQVYVQMLLYEALFTSIGQAIAAFSPSAYFSALVNPIIISTILINFSGVVVPYSQIKAVWRYWIYYLNPFTYMMYGLLQPVVWDLKIQCEESELTNIPLPPSMTCGAYMADFLAENSGYIVSPNSTTSCAYCPYNTGADYLKTININSPHDGWKGVGITTLFCTTSFALVFWVMKIRTKMTKQAV